jgi:hypothetical protein
MSANISIEDSSVQAMHQTVLEFFRPEGLTKGSRFQIAAADAHTGMSIACIRYLTLCVTNTRATNLRVPSSFTEAISSAIRDLYTDKGHSPSLPEVRYNPANLAGTGDESWDTPDFEQYARYLNDRPFITYILGHLNEHLLKCSWVEGIQELISELCKRLTNNPMCYLLECVITTNSGRTQATGEQWSQVNDFLNDLAQAATRMKFPRAVGALLVAGADTEGRLDDKTLLMVSAQNGDQATARALLGRGASMEATDNNEQTALHLAAANGHTAMVRLLVDQGANKEARDVLKQTVLHVAAENDHEGTVQMLVENVAMDREEKNIFGWTALHIAAMRGHGGTIRMLIETLGVERGTRDNGGHTALQFAATLGLEKAVRLLVNILLLDKECKDNEMEEALSLARNR